MRTKAAEIHKHVGLCIRCRRRECGLSQAELGARAGIPIRELQQYELGLAPISAKSLLDVARQLGVDIGYFFRGYDWPPGGESEQLPLVRRTPVAASTLRAAHSARHRGERN